MNDKELWELMSIICEGQDSEQRRKVEQYITDLQQENKQLKDNQVRAMNKIRDFIDNANCEIRRIEQYITDLQQENKILKENAENNDKVVDKVNWENQLLKKENKQLKEEKDKEIERLNNELEEFKEEHKIMKQILIENNLWETLLNDDRFLEYLRK